MFSRLSQQSNINYIEAIKYLREREGLSARQLSLKAGISAGYVSKLEQGGIIPSLVAFMAIVKALHCTDEEILFMLGLV